MAKPCLDTLLARATAEGRLRRQPEGLLVETDYRPWWAQNMLHRSDARFRVVVAGRGVGKTRSAAHELLQLVLAAPPGKEGAAIAPTFTHAEAAVAALLEASAQIPGVEWKAQRKRLMLPGGRSIRVYSADRKETVRGPSLVALWLDEGAYLSQAAVEAALPALRTVGVRTRLIVTTTPAGKNWVWDWWLQAMDPGSEIERFRFRSTDSPFMDQAIIEASRKMMGVDKFAQEYLAEFVDNLLLVFPDRDGLFVKALPDRAAEVDSWMGIDLGKQDWTVLTWMNRFGDTRIEDRWSGASPGVESGRFWGQSDKRIIDTLLRTGSMAVVDTGGPGGAPGAVLAEKLRGAGIPVMEVKTNIAGTKAQIVESLKAETDWRRIQILENDHARQLDYEMSRFQGIKRIRQGREETIYEGPQSRGEHDDCVISLALANWGRVMTKDEAPTAPVDLTRFVQSGRGGFKTASQRQSQMRLGGGRAGSYTFSTPS